MRLKDGSKAWMLIHVEVQGKKEKQFAERMFVYNYRIFDKYRRTMVSFAVLADESEKWRPSDFSYGKWDCEVRMKFPVVRLTDYAAEWEELEKSANPFAVVVMAHLKALETKRNQGQRRYWKLCLCKGLYNRGYSRKDVQMLFDFIDWLMRLPEAAEELFYDEMNAFEEEGKMRYINSARRFGRKEGLQKGIEQSIRRLLLKGISPEETARLLDADEKTVLKIAKEIRMESGLKAA